MKHRIFALAAAAFLFAPPAVFAEEPGGPPPPKDPPPPGYEGRRLKKEKFLENLPPEVRERFEAAREKALQDPGIQELKQSADKANGEFFKAVRKKMIEIDPGLAELVRKRGEGKEMRDRRGEGPVAPGLGSLTDEEREKVLAARDQAKNDPVVKAAEEVKKAAVTPEARRDAAAVYRQAMHEAMVKADPSLKPLLDKLAGPPPATVP